MNLRRRLVEQPIQLQLAPMIDVVMFLLCFFLVTWNLARQEQDLEVKVPTAKNGKDAQQTPGEVIINVRTDGTIELERNVVSADELEEKLKSIATVYPDQAVILRASEKAEYKSVVKVLDVLRAANLTNVAFATTREEQK